MTGASLNNLQGGRITQIPRGSRPAAEEAYLVMNGFLIVKPCIF